MSPRNPLHAVAIVGVYNTRQARVLAGETSLSLTHDAVRGALLDCGLRAQDVDGLNVVAGQGYPDPEDAQRLSSTQLLAGAPVWTGDAMVGIGAVLEAALAISAGLCHTVLIANAQAGQYRDREATAPWTRPTNEFVECWGLHTVVQWAMIAQRHMHLYGTRVEHFAEVASAIRTHGSMNPGAAFYGRGPVTPEQVLASRMIATPYRLLDCAMTGEGGCGLVVTTAERARDLDVKPVYLLGGGREWRGYDYKRPPVWEQAGWVGREAAKRAFAMAGLQPTDVDVCEFYDPFSFEIIHQFEAFGFCKRGEGGPFVMDGRIRLGGEYPICTDGGVMSHGHTGSSQLLQKVVSGVRQLQAAAGDRQVKDARVAMVSNQGFVSRDVLLLGAEPA